MVMIVGSIEQYQTSHNLCNITELIILKLRVFVQGIQSRCKRTDFTVYLTWICNRFYKLNYFFEMLELDLSNLAYEFSTVFNTPWVYSLSVSITISFFIPIFTDIWELPSGGSSINSTQTIRSIDRWHIRCSSTVIPSASNHQQSHEQRQLKNIFLQL